jgi:peroxiredoxin
VNSLQFRDIVPAGRHRRYTLIILALIAAAIASYFIFVGPDSSVPEEKDVWLGFGPKDGDAAPDFTLPNLKGRSVRLSDHRGKVVFLNFWATWCKPCIVEMPSMQALYQRFERRDFEILAVSVDLEGAGPVKKFIATHGLTFPVLLDPNKDIYRLYRLTGVPETFIIDRNGKILLKIIGPREWMKKQWLDYLDQVVERDS